MSRPQAVYAQLSDSDKEEERLLWLDLTAVTLKWKKNVEWKQPQHPMWKSKKTKFKKMINLVSVIDMSRPN
ncbi:hypothetical protein INR49_031190 [Caranx melampygus]|nr:hypothetical protein INR49_031190 [Caranx melampygus]